jgi:hypothetical protein
MMRASFIAVVSLLSIAPAQDPVEITLIWGFPDKVAAEYAVSEIRGGGKPVPRPGQSFVLFPADLNSDGTNNLVVNTCQELPLRVALRLPANAVKPGARWKIEEDYFDSARNAFAKSHAFPPLAARGVQVFQKIEEINGRPCARIESTVQCYELRFDSRDKRDVGTSVLATITTVAWFSVDNTVPVRIQTSFSGRVSEYKGIKQGEEPKTAKANEQLLFELAKEFVKLDLVATRDAVHKAIRQGAEWLKKNRERSGSWVDSGGSFAREFPVGTTALCVMALLHAGVPKDDPAVRDGLSIILKANLSKTYDVGASLMALEAKYLPLEQYEEVVELTEEKARKAIAEKMTPQDKAWVQRAVDWLLAKQTKDGTWGYPDMTERYYDHSNTQYALLGLKSAARCGAKIPSRVWRQIAEHWIGSQKPAAGAKVELKLTWAGEPGVEIRSEESVVPGAWGYFVRPVDWAPIPVPDQGYGNMVCAGLTSLIIAQSELVRTKDLDESLRSRLEAAKRSGLAWIQRHYSVRGCPPAAGFWSVFHLYYLYSLERVGVLYGIKEIAGHDWYLEGAVLLVRDQRTDGGWISYDEIPVVDTAFALLFLKKATLKVATK